MDFKVAGTAKGITALQMDIKIKGITTEILRQALKQEYDARLFILDKMLEVIPVPRAELRSFVPRITTMKVPVEKIGAIFGPGGKIIRAIQEETNVKIDIDDDGTVYIAATDGVSEAAARERIEALTESAQVGHIYTGKVVRVADFGAFVQILPGIDGMVHISQLDTERVEKVEDVVKLGDELTVMVTAIDENGKIRLSRQAVLEGWTPEEALEHDKGGKSGGGRPRSGGNRSYNDRGGNRGDRNNRR
jgi:polyribonucleotide nucleotidyltransferase